jgi:hypothetical protein
MGRVIKNNGLSIVLFLIFVVTLAGQFFAGWKVHNESELQHGRPPVSAAEYVAEPHFLEAVFENWESEFLQMAAYVIFTIFLFQKGSSESKQPDTIERVDVIVESSKDDPEMPWPVRRGGFALKLYEHSLSLALLALFAISFVFHAVSGARQYSSEQAEHGGSPVTTVEFMGTPTFWFESFQNWQSEFLSVGVIVVLSIFLRQRGSPESKPVDTPHSSTGSD